MAHLEVVSCLLFVSIENLGTGLLATFSVLDKRVEGILLTLLLEDLASTLGDFWMVSLLSFSVVARSQNCAAFVERRVSTRCHDPFGILSRGYV